MRNTQPLVIRAAALRDGDLDAPLTVRFTRNDHNRLVAYAREHGVSAGDVVRVALKRMLLRESLAGSD